jgi:hypothetical protein
MPETKQEQVIRNYAAFTEKLPLLLKEQPEKFALMRDGEIVEFFDTARDAYITGNRLYADGLFSIQQVINEPADLGFFSHAVPIGTV